MKRILQTLVIGSLAALFLVAAAWAGGDKTTVTADAALKMLEEGNKRFVAGQFDNAHKIAPRLQEVAKGQKPFAVIVGCSDSRVPPEVVFDQGLGDIFIIRLAGNVVDSMALGSIEYAVDHFGAPLIVVLGHKRCGAVDATLEAVEKKQKVPGNLPALVNAIKPAVVKTKGKHEEHLDAAIRLNAENVANKLEANPVLKKHKTVIIQGYYNLDTGAVNFWTKR